MTYHILLTIDVEDWFQVENFKECIPFSSWPSCELRVEKNTHRILDLLDEVSVHRSYPISEALTSEALASPTSLARRSFQAKAADPRPLTSGSAKATFFVLGWVAERLPRLVREIHSRGHEVASHGFSHELCTKCSHEELKKDLSESKNLLEDIIGSQIQGYRAPSFSIDDEILKMIQDCGYLYDSSYNSFSIHGRYGTVSLNGHRKRGIAYQLADNFFELPVSNLRLGGRVLPWGGGGYFRLTPLRLFIRGVERILSKSGDYLMYVHPWEIDSEQPKIKGGSPFLRFRHYANISRNYSKLFKFIEKFKRCTFMTCFEQLRAEEDCEKEVVASGVSSHQSDGKKHFHPRRMV